MACSSQIFIPLGGFVATGDASYIRGKLEPSVRLDLKVIRKHNASGPEAVIHAFRRVMHEYGPTVLNSLSRKERGCYQAFVVGKDCSLFFEIHVKSDCNIDEITLNKVERK